MPSTLLLLMRGKSANRAIFWHLHSANGRFITEKEKRKPALKEYFSPWFLERSFHNFTNARNYDNVKGYFVAFVLPHFIKPGYKTKCIIHSLIYQYNILPAK